ncbi:MAG: CPBP family intramembrane glutamic endopeptidase [Pseudomonadota bacterium]
MTHELRNRGYTQLGPGRDHRVWPFFLLIFTSWLLWIPAGARIAGVLPFAWPFEIAFAGAFIPCLLAVWMTARTAGTAGVITLLKRFVAWRFPARYWAYAVFAMPLSAFATALVLSGNGEPNLVIDGIDRLLSGDAMQSVLDRDERNVYESAGPADAYRAISASSPIAFALAFVGLALVEGGVSEEPGWRAWAYPILRDRWAALPAAMVVGLFWALWHIGPQQWAILFEDGTGAFLAFLPEHMLLYIIGVLPLAIIFSWLYEATGGSLLVCFVVHASFNITSTMSNAMFDGPVVLGVIGFLWTTVATVLWRVGWRRFSASTRGSHSRDPQA